MKKNYPISSSVRKELRLFETCLLSALAQAPRRIAESTSQVIKAGGKRLRPALVILSAQAGDYRSESVMKGAMAVELIHLASLIHDDILDRADTRRGFPTINAVSGHKHAVAVGDYLFGLAFQILAKFGDSRLIKPLSNASMALSRGEMMERETAHKSGQKENEYLYRVKCKTASLFKAACVIGSMIGGGAPSQNQSMAAYGLNLGMAFQIYDDILDLTGDEAELGKPVGTDLREGVATLPMLIAMKEKGGEVVQEALHFSDDISIENALTFIRAEGAVTAAKESARRYLDIAVESISAMNESPVKQDLVAIGDFVVNRYH